jgi:transposase-like protein
MLWCPECKSETVVKNGHIHNGKQRYLCKSCGRQFVPDSTKKVVEDQTKALIDRLLLEKLPLAGIARAVQVSQTWLQAYVNQKYKEVPKVVGVEEKRGL